MRTDISTSILTALNGTSTDIEASAIISINGLTIATMPQANMDEDRAWALNSAMLLLGDRTAQELGRSTVEQVLIKGDRGYVLMTHAGNEAVLTVLAKPNARLGLIFLDVNKAAQSIAEML
jgi:predicted regulator of Ras-like GTPase activity (Roadblock/LC7/MglB family)